jgi:hypothetical protein
MNRFNSIALLFCCFLIQKLAFSQLTIDNTSHSVSELVSEILIPSADGTVISNVQFSGVYNISSRYQVGYFSTATTTRTQMGFNSGVMLTSGNTSEMPLSLGTDPKNSQVSRNYTSCTTGELRKSGTCGVTENDLNILSSGQNYFNVAVLEFDFVPLGDAVAFRYIFGSEEFEDNSGLINYQCSDYNDRFAFLLSGPGVSGGQGYENDAKNIARLNNNSIVAINAVNNGVVGSSGGSPNALKCIAANASWVNGSPVSEFLGTIDGTQMNGNTKMLTAYQAGLTPGQTYHIKMMIMDVSDGAYDSVVYLEEGSFITDPILLPVELTSFEGKCKNEGIELSWKTASERNNNYFTLERASDLGVFEELMKINGIGNSSTEQTYSFNDNSAFAGVNYYKLYQTDLDGTRTFLNQITVNNVCNESATPLLDVIFNSQEQHIEILYQTNERQKVDLKLFDQTGKLLMTKTIQLNPNQNKELLKLDTDLSSGIYFLLGENFRFKWNKKMFIGF